MISTRRMVIGMEGTITRWRSAQRNFKHKSFVYPWRSKITFSLSWSLVICDINFKMICHNSLYPLKRQSGLQQTTNYGTSFLIFEKNKVWYFMRIICQQTILKKYHALFFFFWKSSKIWNCRLLQIIGGALWVKFCHYYSLAKQNGEHFLKYM